MKNLTNYHSHCSFCDGHADAEAFVEEAVRCGYTAYGISSHAPLPYPTRWTMEREEVPAYLAEMTRLKEKYAGQIELYTGMEIDYLDETHNPAMPFFRDLPLDYRIGAVHLLRAPDGTIVDIDTAAEVFAKNLELHWEGDLRRALTDFFDKMTRLVEAGGFDFVAHIDKFSYNASCVDPELTGMAWYEKQVEDALDLIAARGLMLEVNTKNFARRGIFHPHRRHFERLRELRIPLVVNSDAHRPESIGSGRREALQALREAGIGQVAEFRGGRWQAVPIE